MLLRCRSSVVEKPVKKRKMNKASVVVPHTTISSLPDDLVLRCLARVSRLYYPSLSFVCKKFRSLIASPEIFKVRSLLGLTESCLYVCIDFGNCDPRWFTLSKKSKEENCLVPIPSRRRGNVAGVVAIGSSIYWIGGIMDSRRVPSSRVSILDCRSHTWQEAPNMSVARKFLAANVIDGKIYVVGGRLMRDCKSSNLMEFLDPETQIWNSVSPGPEICRRTEMIDTTVIDGKILMYNDGKSVAYNPKEGTCEPIEWEMCKAWVISSHCVVDNVVFYHDSKGFKWLDIKARLGRDLKGLEGMPKIDTKYTSVIFADYGGKIAVFWDKYVSSSRPFWDKHGGREDNKEIWCAVIAIERRNSEDIWGTVEWFGVVLTVPKSCRFVRALATTC